MMRIGASSFQRDAEMHRQQRSLLFDSPVSMLAVAVMCLVCLGCDAGVDLAPVDGVVQFEGSPMASGIVLLTPLGGGKAAAGDILEGGEFHLTTMQPDDGAVPGKYRVTIVSDLKLQGREVHATCSAPKNLILEVETGKENHFDINVNAADGWQLSADD